MASTSLASARVTTCAARPSITARAWAPEPPCELSIVSGGVAFGLPVRVEGLVVVAVELARRVVGDVEELGLRLGRAGEAGGDERGGRAGGDAARGAAEKRADGAWPVERCRVPKMSKRTLAAARGSADFGGAGSSVGVSMATSMLLSDYHDRGSRH